MCPGFSGSSAATPGRTRRRSPRGSSSTGGHTGSPKRLWPPGSASIPAPSPTGRRVDRQRPSDAAPSSVNCWADNRPGRLRSKRGRSAAARGRRSGCLTTNRRTGRRAETELVQTHSFGHAGDPGVSAHLPPCALVCGVVRTMRAALPCNMVGGDHRWRATCASSAERKRRPPPPAEAHVRTPVASGAFAPSLASGPALPAHSTTPQLRSR